ncbi:type 2 isopentenyl-diphosphate Delta-isomerase [Legionella yabuuchiae]|uniref:type 2 isopentenyl-diphosphate Delta-isomerase n=1 Tax=Legionella yabuuchiae TaxID=376727 RepID=UPI0010559E47|nr:type 2 isopentenyl-diphosphate Delta-isomerase [Legionella yabuuchiae]
MSDDYSQFERRKQDHIDLALMQANQTSELNPFDRMALVHEALPDMNFNEIDIRGERFGTRTKPFIVSSMTAGHRNAVNINHNLIAACSEQGWAMGVGSQRRELTDEKAADEWHVLRQEFPNVVLYSNLGIAQLISSSLEQIQQITSALNAEALIIHCNPLQECIQPEGTPSFKGGWDALAMIVEHLDIPVIVKETGCGFSLPTLLRLNEIGVGAVDVSGVGGTHWGRIEGHRASHDPIRQSAATTFKNWGIDTIQSVKDAISIAPRFEVWGSGGVRHGLDAAKLFALGATTVGFAKPMLTAALTSSKAVIEHMAMIEYELKVAMFCTGSRELNELKEKACR